MRKHSQEKPEWERETWDKEEEDAKQEIDLKLKRIFILWKDGVISCKATASS